MRPWLLARPFHYPVLCTEYWHHVIWMSPFSQFWIGLLRRTWLFHYTLSSIIFREENTTMCTRFRSPFKCLVILTQLKQRWLPAPRCLQKNKSRAKRKGKCLYVLFALI